MPRLSHSSRFINKIILLHQVGISSYVITVLLKSSFVIYISQLQNLINFLNNIFVCKLASFGYLPGVQFSKADVSEPSVGSIFKAGLNPALKMEPTEGSETSAFENWTPGRYPKEANLHSRHGESLRTKNIFVNCHLKCTRIVFQCL